MMRTSGIFLKEKKTKEINDEKQSVYPFIKKRANERVNEIITKALPCTQHISNSYGDRFIPRRYCLEPRLQNYYLSKNKFKAENKIFSDFIDARLTDGYWRWQNFKTTLDNVMGNENQRLFQFNDIVQKQAHRATKTLPMVRNKKLMCNLERFDWPCKPRSRPLALEDSTHDMPRYNTHQGKEIMGWSAKGQMAAVFLNKLILWDPDDDTTRIYLIKYIEAIAFNPSGDLLVTSRIRGQKSVLQIWDIRNPNNMFLYNSYYPPSVQDNKISCVEWDISGANLVCGYEDGKLQILDSLTLREVKVLKHHKFSIYSIKFSPNMKYLATSDVKAWIYIFQWCNHKFHLELENLTKAPLHMEWHPWNDVDLIIAEPVPAAINVYNVSSETVVAHYNRNDNKLKFDSLTISKLSGELFLGCTIKNADGSNSYEVIVLASLERVVDVLKNHNNTIRCMLWNPNNLQLATVGDDDIVTIWNIFSINNANVIKQKMRNSSYDSKQNSKEYTIWERLKSIR